MKLQGDGNLLTYAANTDGTLGTLLWASNTWGNYGATAVFGTDGILKINKSAGNGGAELWRSDNKAVTGASLYADRTGLSIVRANGVPAWTTSGVVNTGDTAALQPGEQISTGVKLAGSTAPSTSTRLTMQADGNLLLEKGTSTLWSSREPGVNGWYSGGYGEGTYVAGSTLSLANGKLNMKLPTGFTFWQSSNNASPGATLKIQGDGNMVIYNTNNQAIWATNTFG
ncbi:hypothetical protein OHV05_35550 (plasmid) [Kitasatospora sp. NBC_00070]|uniref:hypothetical protein n=1 Tax=Kitasatospora sp. NBC_00070 TaxID=2975962 RepID=UPI002F907879